VGQTAKNLSRLVALIALAVAPIAGHAAEPPPLAAYGELPSFEDAALSPSGERLAVLATIRGVRSLLILDRTMTPKKSFAVDEIKVRGFQWIGEDKLLLRTSQTEDLPMEFVSSQAELQRAVILPVDSDEVGAVVFERQEGIFGSVFGFYGVRRVGDRWKAYFRGIELGRTGRVEYGLAGSKMVLFEVDVETNRARRIGSPPGESSSRNWLVDEAGEIAAILDVKQPGGDWTIQNGSGDVLARGRNKLGRVGLSAIGSTGDTLLYSTEDDESGEIRLFEVPLAGGAAPQQFLPEVDVERFYTDRMSGRIVGYLPANAGDEAVFYDPKRQSAARAVHRAFPNLEVNLVEWTPDFGDLLVATTGNGDSGSWYLVDVALRQAQFIGSERPAIDPSMVGPISTFAYTAADGLELDGILTLPPGREAKNLPLVMLPHGGPHAHDAEVFDWWAQAFASRGYAVFQPNFRGSTNRDEAFVRAGYGEWGRKMQTDISDGLAALAAKGIVDPKRACIMGASYGGYAALAGVTLQQGLYRCAVAVAPVSDIGLTVMTDYREGGRSRIARLSLAEEFGPRDRYDDISPRQQAARASAPILLIHGREDTVVPFKQSEVMADALKDARKPYKLVDLEAEDHWLTRSKTRQRMLGAAMEFVLEHNPPD
jgi:dipeptidyl aminopeptidase/acylaminoacyl peptidase